MRCNNVINKKLHRDQSGERKGVNGGPIEINQNEIEIVRLAT